MPTPVSRAVLVARPALHLVREETVLHRGCVVRFGQSSSNSPMRSGRRLKPWPQSADRSSVTGVSDTPLLRGVRISGHTAVTHSILMRARSKTVRMIEAYHDLAHKTIRLRSTKLETPI